MKKCSHNEVKDVVKLQETLTTENTELIHIVYDYKGHREDISTRETPLCLEFIAR